MRSPRHMEPRWFTTSDGSVFPLTSSTSNTPQTSYRSTTNPSSESSTFSVSTSTPANGAGPTGTSLKSSVPIPISYTFTSSVPFPITTTLSSTGSLETITTTALSVTTVTTQTTSWSLMNIGSSRPTGTPTPQSNARSICAGDGNDTMSLGVISTLIFGTAVGALIWVGQTLCLLASLHLIRPFAIEASFCVTEAAGSTAVRPKGVVYKTRVR